MRWNYAQIRTDLVSGLVATILLLPESMVYGAIAFAPLGSAYISLGIAAGLIGVIFSNIGGATVGGAPLMLTKPQSLAAIMLAAILQTILFELETSLANPEAVAIALSLLFLVVIASGLSQIVLGLFRVGSLFESIPYPVITGLRNGTYITIVLAQLAPLLGLPKFSPLQLFEQLPTIQPYTVLVGVVTMAAGLVAGRWARQIPAPLVGIVVGTAFYHLLASLGLADQLGPLIGKIPNLLPTPHHLLTVWQQLDTPRYLPTAVAILPLSIGITAIITIKSAEAALIADSATKERTNFNRELIGQGVGNLFAGLFGGIHNAGNSFVPATIYQLGARTSLARVSCALFVLSILLFIGPLVALIPLTVLAGTLIIATRGLVSKWSLAQIRELVRGELTEKGMVDLLIVLLVAGVLIVVGIYEAVLFGLIVSVAYFIYRMTQTAVRAIYNGATVHSNTQRTSDEIAWLAAHGHAIRIIELQGSLFFATTSRLIRISQSLLANEEIHTLILDLAHVSDIDSTGVAMLLDLRAKAAASERLLYLSGIAPGSEVATLLTSFGLLNRFGAAAIFRTLNDALEQAEIELLMHAFGKAYPQQRIPLAKVRGLRHLRASDLAVLQTFLTYQTFAAGETIVQEGDTDRRLFYSVQGCADLMVWSAQAQQSTRIGSFRPGTTFGEMAILDGGPRSATIIAAEPLVCYALTAEALGRLKAAHPEIAYQLLIGLGVELASRTRHRALWA